MSHTTAMPIVHVLRLDGDEYASIKCPFDNETQFTISLWARPTGPAEGDKRGLIGNPRSTHDPSLYLNPANGGLYFETRKASDTGSGNSREIPGFFEMNQWTHVTWVKMPGRQHAFYRNGRQVSSQIITDRLFSSGESYRIGGAETNWIGEIAEVRIYNIARAAEDIEHDFARRLVGNEPGLVGYWPFDRDSHPSQKDWSPSGNHCVLRGRLTFPRMPLPLVEERPTAAETPQPDPGGYAYWLRWRQAERKKPDNDGNDASFRRGLIWR